jgi:hypothetical protein
MIWVVFAWAVLTFLSFLGHMSFLSKNEYPRKIERKSDVGAAVFSVIMLAVLLAVLFINS